MTKAELIDRGSVEGRRDDSLLEVGVPLAEETVQLLVENGAANLQQEVLGVATVDECGKLAYECRWAIDRGQERALFEWFIDFTFEQLQRFPDLHIYHFGGYEPGAIKRLMLRYATREEEVAILKRSATRGRCCFVMQCLLSTGQAIKHSPWVRIIVYVPNRPQCGN